MYDFFLTRMVVLAVEGWVIFVTGVHQDANEDDIRDVFGDFGLIKNLHLNLDRRTGYVKGYALIEYQSESEALVAIKSMHQKRFLGKDVSVDWAFVRGSRVDTFAGKGLHSR